MVLSAILRLDAAGFTTPLGKALEGMKAAIRIGGDLGRNLKQAFDTGGMLSDLAAQTGESAGDLMILKQAFEDTGVGGEALGQTLAMMRRSLAGISESGKPVKQIFNQLGLDIESIKGMGAREQLQTIAGAIGNLRTPSEQSAASMEIFGRSGAKMLTLFKDPAALDAAAKSLGGLPGLMDRNAAAFDAVSDRMGRIKQKGQGLWAGIAEGLLPLADQVTETLDGIDLTGIGQRIGTFVGATVKLFKEAPLGDTIEDLLTIGFGEAVNYGSAAFAKLGDKLLDALIDPLVFFSAKLQKIIEDEMERFDKANNEGNNPLLDALGVGGIFKKFGPAPLPEEDLFQALSLPEIIKQQKADLKALKDSITEDIPDWGGKFDLFDTSAAKSRVAAAYDPKLEEYLKALEGTQKAADAPIGTGTAALTGAAAEDTGGGGSLQTLSDALTRIGGYTGGGMQDRLAGFTERTARATERIAGYLANQRGGQAVPVWGA